MNIEFLFQDRHRNNKRVSMGLTVNRQMAVELTVNRHKQNIFTVNVERAKISHQTSQISLNDRDRLT